MNRRDQAPYYCEICGRPVYRKREYLIDGTTMILCSSCAQYGKPIEMKTKRRQEKRQLIRKKKAEKMVKEVFEEEWELAPDFHLRIKRAREKLGLSQEQLSLKIGEAVSYIRRLEQGKIKPTDVVIDKLEKTLNVSLRVSLAPPSSEDLSEEEKRERVTLGDIVVVKKKKKK